MTNNKKIAVILSGCGVFDGAEIHETTMTLLAIARQGAGYELFAPDIDQHHVINHLTGDEMDETRNVLVESARIARGKISPLRDFHADNYDGVILPGGFGAAKNLSTFAFDGAECNINEEVESAIRTMTDKGKPVGALCISPVILARLYGDVELTIGQDQGTIAALEQMGARHVATDHAEVVVDKKLKLVTTPCYMLDATIIQIAQGAENVVREVLALSQ